MTQEEYSGITQEDHDQALLLSLWKGQMDIQSKMATVKMMAEEARQWRIKALQEWEEERQARVKAEQEAEQERVKAEQEQEKAVQERERAEQKLAQERERSIAAMRALGMSDKDIDKIYPDK
ncbi:hypothetical protein FACS1894200_06150 [Spirochaetia bacterium]|nr:hypothetical protein FACS1894200_06150 [Spirochaetia bacterium]